MTARLEYDLEYCWREPEDALGKAYEQTLNVLYVLLTRRDACHSGHVPTEAIDSLTCSSRAATGGTPASRSNPENTPRQAPNSIQTLEMLTLRMLSEEALGNTRRLCTRQGRVSGLGACIASLFPLHEAR